MRTPFHALARLAPFAPAAPALGHTLGPVPEPAASPSTAASPTPPAVEWISTRSPGAIRPKRCRP